MLEENKDIDNLFKSVVEPYTMEPPGKVWSSLDAELTKGQSAKKGYYGFKFLSITVAAVMLSFAAYQILTPTSYFNTRKTQENNPTSPIAGYGANDNAAKTETANAYNNTRTSQNADNDNVSNTNSQADYVQNNSSNVVQASLLDNRVEAGSTEDNAGNSNSLTTGSSNNNNATKSNSATDATPASSQTASGHSGTNSSGTVNENEEAKTVKAGESTKGISDSVANSNENSAEDDAANLSLLSLKTKRHFSIDAFYSPDIVEGTSSINSNTTQNVATTSTEKFNLSFNTGAMLRYDVNDRWSISIGCTYSTLNYSTSLTTSYVVPAADSGKGSNHQWNFPHSPGDTTLSQNFNDPDFFNHYFPYSASTNTFNYNNNLGSIQLHGNPVFSTPSSNQPGEVVYFTTNTNMILQYINIPLTISYKISSRRFDYYVSGGVSIDFLVNQQATVIIGDAYSETTNDITGLSKTSYGYLFGAGVRYHLYKSMSVFIEPGFRGALTSITTAPSNNFYPYYFGLNTGVSIHF